MSAPKKIAIIGRPNVGKSALFNAIIKKRVAIVDEQEGVTRDRLYHRSDFFGYPFELIDTGGIDTISKEPIVTSIRKQAQSAIEEADSIIMVVDSRTPPQELDTIVAKMVRNQSKPVTLAVNKIDSPEEQDRLWDYSSLGIPNMIGVSAIHGFQVTELVDLALAPFDKNALIDTVSTPPKIAIIGRPNVGKSALLNALSGSDRVIVSPTAGTTRDAIDTPITYDGETFLFIDTAGIRKRHKEKESVEKFAHLRTDEALERADIALLVMDSQSGMSTEEKKILAMIEKKEKAFILLFNKWDLNQGFRMEHCLRGLEEEIPFIKGCPKLFISAKTGRNVDKIFDMIREVKKSSERRITTGALNKSLIAAMQEYHPPVVGTRRLRVYYMTQVSTRPPRFVLFVNSPLAVDGSYKRYLINHLRASFGFWGVPIFLKFIGKDEKREVITRNEGCLDRDLKVLSHFAQDRTREKEDRADQDAS
jgi:GTP-binding protein